MSEISTSVSGEVDLVITPPRPDPIDPDPDTVDPAMLIGAGTSDAPTATATRPVSPDTEETAP